MSANSANQNQDMNGGCDLATLEQLNDSDDLLRQLTENTFELDSFFTEFSAAEIKVSPRCRQFENHFMYILCISLQEENNNDLPLQENNENYLSNCNNLLPTQSNSNNNNDREEAMMVINQHGSGNDRLSSSQSRFSIAANPLLAEKLLSPNLTNMDNSSLGNRTGRPPDIKGKCHNYLIIKTNLI